MPKREYARLGETVYYDTLPNGLRVVTVPRAGFRKAAAYLMVGCGGVDRGDAPLGAAHFLEHKLFEMPEGENALTVMTRRGANANAFTASDVTAYHFISTSDFFENLETLLSFVNTPYFTDESVEREKPIIAREIAMTDDEPDTALYYGLLGALFKKNPIRDPVLGTVGTISAMTPADLYAYHKKFYTPANMILTVVGPGERDRILDLASRHTPSGPSLPPERGYGEESVERPYRKTFRERRDISAPIFLTGVKTAPAVGANTRLELVAALALNVLMSEGSPLWSELYDGGLINDTFSFDYETSAGVSFLSFGGETEHSDRVVERVFAEAQRLSKNGIPADYFERCRKAAVGDELRALDSFDNVAYNAALSGLYGYDYFDTLPTLLGITREEVMDFLGEYMTAERAATAKILVKEAV